MRKICLLSISLLMAVHSHAAFEIYNYSVRGTSLEDAFGSLGDDATVLMYNPATMGRLKRSQVLVSYAKPHIDFGNVELNNFGLFFAGVYGRSTVLGGNVAVLDTNLSYREVWGTINYAGSAGKYFDKRMEVFFGINGKVMSMRRGDPNKPFDPALAVQTITKTTVDLGGLVKYERMLLGYSVANVIPANFAVIGTANIPTEKRLSLGFERIYTIPETEVTLSPTVEYSSRNKIDKWSGGCIVELLKAADFQMGISEDNATFGFSIYPRGKGGKKRERSGKDMRIDAAYRFPINGLDSGGSPSIACNFYF